MRLISASNAPAVRSRKRSSKARPLSRKKTNMLSESKYTVAPNTLARSNVPQLLVTKVMAIPIATGTSMPPASSRPLRTSPGTKFICPMKPATNGVRGWR